MKTPSEKLTLLKRRFARAVLRSASALADSNERTALLTRSLPLLLGLRCEWNAERAHALDVALAASFTPEARRAARAAIARAHAKSFTYGSAPDGHGIVAHLPSGETLRGRFVGRRFEPDPKC